jgi:hypothetical protein
MSRSIIGPAKYNSKSLNAFMLNEVSMLYYFFKVHRILPRIFLLLNQMNVLFLMWTLWVYGGFPMLDIECIAFARYPPRPDTSHDGGLVGLHPLSHESYMSSQFLLW